MSMQFPDKAYGSMSLTWTATPPPREESIKILQYVYEKKGIKHFNGGMFYQMTPEFNNLALLRDFFKTINGQDCILSFKGCINSKFIPESSPELIDAEIAIINQHFNEVEHKPKIIYNIARIDKTRPIEEVAKYLDSKVQQGAISGFGISECSKETLQRAASVAKISLLELELSIMTQDIIELGTLKIASDYQIPIICYSPMAKGLLTDRGASPNFLNSLPETDRRLLFGFDRFQKGHYDANYGFLKSLYDFAHEVKHCNLEQLALSYIYKLSGLHDFKGIKKVTQLIPLPGSANIANIDKTYVTIDLTDEELIKIQDIIDGTKVHGGRYNATLEPTLHG